jgi:uncharacterized protein YhfF
MQLTILSRKIKKMRHRPDRDTRAAESLAKLVLAGEKVAAEQKASQIMIDKARRDAAAAQSKSKNFL